MVWIRYIQTKAVGIGKVKCAFSLTGSLRRSRQSCGKIPSPPEMKLSNKRRTPSPTIEDMPPFKKLSQEVATNLQEHLLKLQALVSDSSGTKKSTVKMIKIMFLCVFFFLWHSERGTGYS
jgi:hypothetical protein